MCAKLKLRCFFINASNIQLLALTEIVSFLCRHKDAVPVPVWQTLSDSSDIWIRYNVWVWTRQRRKHSLSMPKFRHWFPQKFSDKLASAIGWVKETFFWISNLHIEQTMYFGVKLRTFQGFFIPVWFGVGQVQKTELSSHLKTLKLPVGGGAMFKDSWHL